jgi:uncharacterized membrane protein (UPF0127 family)
VRIALALAAFVSLAVAQLLPATAAEGVLPLSAFPRERIAIETRSARRHVFEAWRADTDETRMQGLMFVRELRPDQAMIFVYPRPGRVAMWMKNTYVSLDMLFVDEGGCVVMVREGAEPGSLATIAAEGPVRVVVELVAGSAEALGVRVGDRVLRLDAGWPRAGAACTAPR